MEQDIKSRIQERFAELPADVQRAIQSSNLDAKLQTIGTKYKLHIDQIGILGDETRLVMLGFAEPDEFAPQLMQRLSISQEQAGAIAQEVSNELFLPIRESMQQFMEESALAEHLASEAKSTEKSVVMPSKAAAMAAEIKPAPAVAPAPASPAAPMNTAPVPASKPATSAAPAATPASPTTQMPKPEAPKPASAPMAMPISAEKMLKEPTVSLPKPPPAPAPAPVAPNTPAPQAQKAEPPKPGNYKTDPYREPVE